MHEVIGDVRGKGLLIGVELVKDPCTKEPATEKAEAMVEECLKNGLLFSLRRGGSVLRFVPPFCTTDDEIERGL